MMGGAIADFAPTPEPDVVGSIDGLPVGPGGVGVRMDQLSTNGEREPQKNTSWMFGMIIGIAVGISLGVALGKIAVGVGVGTGVGVALAIGLRQRSKSKDESDDGYYDNGIEQE